MITDGKGDDDHKWRERGVIGPLFPSGVEWDRLKKAGATQEGNDQSNLGTQSEGVRDGALFG